jgi:hypothetical protein
MHQDKKTQRLGTLYQHCAQYGMSKFKSISDLAKVLGIKRQLFYFYFDNLETCLTDLYEYHKYRVDSAYKVVTKGQFSFSDYVHYMVDDKDIYYFSMQCVRYQSQHPKFLECLQHSLNTMDHYNYQQFVVYCQLSAYPQESIHFMYKSFREYWWTHSGEYTLWDHDKVSELVNHVDGLVELLKQR